MVNKPDASNLILEQDTYLTLNSLLNVRRTSRNTTEENGVSLRRKRRAIKGFKRRMLNSPLTKKFQEKEVVLTTERAKRSSEDHCLYASYPGQNTKVRKKGIQVRRQKATVYARPRSRTRTKILTSAGTDAFEKQRAEQERRQQKQH